MKFFVFASALLAVVFCVAAEEEGKKCPMQQFMKKKMEEYGLTEELLKELMGGKIPMASLSDQQQGFFCPVVEGFKDLTGDKGKEMIDNLGLKETCNKNESEECFTCMKTIMAEMKDKWNKKQA